VVYAVRVQPRSSRNEVVRNPDGTLKVYLTSPPVDGRANAELVNILSEEFGVPKGAVKIIRGAKGREKLVEISER
jgi:uncharacterized protein (TIGR00251 family)